MISPMPGPPPRQHKHEKQYTPSTHSVIPTRRRWNDDDDSQMIFGDLGGLKFPDICLTGEEKPRKKTSPRKLVPTVDRTRARCVTSAHATTCSTAVDNPQNVNLKILSYCQLWRANVSVLGRNHRNSSRDNVAASRPVGRLRTATVSGLSSSTWPSLNKFHQSIDESINQSFSGDFQSPRSVSGLALVDLLIDWKYPQIPRSLLWELALKREQSRHVVSPSAFD